jgi:hypothetical protein
MLISTIFVAALSACSPAPASGADPQVYAQTTEMMLKAVNNNDYAQFSADFNDQMKQTFTEDDFRQLSAAVKTKLGSYVADEFYGIESQSGLTVVTYMAKFTDKSETVTVKIGFQKAGGKNIVSGFNLDLPGLHLGD